MREWIVGRHPVYEVLRAGRRQPFKLLIAQGVQEKGRLEDILRLCKLKRIAVENVPRSRLDAYGEVHQGVALQVSEYPYGDLGELLARIQRSREPASLLILDALQDPQNLGTLLRTAEAVGIQGVLIPKRRTATISPAVVSASSGACEHLFIVQANLAQAIGQLKDAGIWIIGLDNSERAKTPDQIHLDIPVALVVGNEAQGIRQLVRKSCDVLMSLPMRGRVESLNAAVAGSVALYLTWQARGYPVLEK